MLDLEGKDCPEFSVKLSDGTELNKNNMLGQTFILFFYPKDFTPGCTMEVCNMRDIYSSLAEQGIKVFGVSKDSYDKHTKFREKYDLPYELISDADGDLCKIFGVWQEKSMFGKKYMGIARSTFIIDANSKVAKVWPKVAVTKHSQQILEYFKI